MSDQKETVFSLLAKPIQESIRERGLSHPTEPQQKAMPLIIEGKNVLLISPTASGKTEAALLPTLSTFISSHRVNFGIKILYITPLRALNRDMMERVEWWCERLDVKVAVRHGDTETSERGRQAKDPPDMLITTPETLQAILTGRVMKKHLQEVRFVIIDEVHELAENKRGSQLTLALERLRWITMRDFQIIGLSATIGTPEEVGKFLVGNDREVEIVKVPVARRTRLKIICPKEISSDYKLAVKLYTHPEVASRLRVMRDLIQGHDSVILFTNTRAAAEVLASRFKVWDMNFPVSIHHGSLSKPARLSAERGLKNGELKGLVATSSLELGIDVGRIDFVIQYMSPKQVTRLIQRVGRSGHSVGRLADGSIISMDPDDTLEALVIARKTYEENLEPVSIPNKPLDVLAHQIVGLLLERRKWIIDEILELFKNAYPYRNLKEKEIESVLAYMHSRYPRLAWISLEDRVVLRPRNTKPLYTYYFGKLSMIPDQKQYLVMDETSDTPIGVLDEAFIAEYGEPGTKFIVKGSAWKMTMIMGDKIYAKPIKDPTGSIPSWIGEEIPVPFEIASEVGQIRAYVEKELNEGTNRKKIAGELAKIYSAESHTILRSLEDTFEQIEKGYIVPTDKRMVLESFDEYIIINAHFGTLVNRTLARLLAHILSEKKGYTVGIQQDPYRIVLETDGTIDCHYVLKTLKELVELNIEDLLDKASMKSGLFKRRMVQVAKRFGAISRRVNFQNISLRKLFKSFEETAILEEALKETYDKDLNISNTLKVLEEIKKKEIEIAIVEPDDEATPITRIGMEKISRKTDLIPPEKIERILLVLAKARILNEYETFVCTDCWKDIRTIRIKDLPKKLLCADCGKNSISVLKVSEEEIKKIIKKGNKRLSSKEKEILESALESSELIKKYGKAAACVLSGKKIELSDAYEILNEENRISDKLFKLIMEAEKEALKRRFW